MSFYIRFMPSYKLFSTLADQYITSQLLDEIQQCGKRLGAGYCYVQKALSNGKRPLTFRFYAKGGKVLSERTPNGLVELTAQSPTQEPKDLAMTASGSKDFYIRFMPTYIKYGTAADTVSIKMEQEIKRCGESLGADYAYVCKNFSGSHRPLTFSFYAKGGKFLGRRTTNSVYVR